MTAKGQNFAFVKAEVAHDACKWPVAEFERGVFLFCGEPAGAGVCAEN